MSSMNTVVPQSFCVHPARSSNIPSRDAHMGLALGRLPVAA
ncbi:hypothetical protein [Nocardia miyunensis]|nr:hypothetical protein [Nocardia miyunensis]